MEVREHFLIPQASGTQRKLVSWHFGVRANGPKVVLQASLHADELPGMLVLLHLKELLQRAEVEQQLQGEVVLVPMANPIGLDQTVMHSQLGRFELASAQNFNRHYPRFAEWLAQPDHALTSRLGADAKANTRIIRSAMLKALELHPPVTELDSLRHTLMRLAVDADFALDLHCDFEAAVHLYTEPPCLDRLRPLATRLGAVAVLVAEGSGGHCYDESLSGVWWQLPALLRQLHPGFVAPIEQACVSATVELRGQTDVSHDHAQTDAQALVEFLKDIGALQGPSSPEPPELCRPTPLAGTQVLTAPHPGVLVYHRQAGDWVEPGDTVAEVIDPLGQKRTSLRSEVRGVVYARHIVRWATTGLDVGKISGEAPRRTGLLLGA